MTDATKHVPERLPPERWARVKELFVLALDRDAEARNAYLEEACAGDAALLENVLKLLASDERAGNFLERPAIMPPVGTGMEWMIGRRAGPYQIIREIGRGGMGTVFL